MNWQEFRKILSENIKGREENKIICVNEEKASELLRAVNKVLQHGLIIE